MRQVARAIVAVVPMFVGTATVVSQPLPRDENAYLTIFDGRGVTIDHGDGEFALEAKNLATNSDLESGARIRTDASGTAVLLFPNSGAVIHLGGSTDVRLIEASSSNHSLTIMVASGRVTMVRRAGGGNWLVLGAEIAGGPVGYVISKDASVVVEVGEGKITYSARRGDVLLFERAVPRGEMFDAADSPKDATGVEILEGQQRTVRVVGDSVADPQSGSVVPDTLADSAWRFAGGQSAKWLEDAEAGDFTPVTATGGPAQELLSAELEPSLVFDQARPVLTTSTGSRGLTPVQPRPSVAQTLVESNIPGTVVAARRFAGSRIIGISGQSGSGALFVNVTPLTLPIRLGDR